MRKELDDVLLGLINRSGFAHNKLFHKLVFALVLCDSVIQLILQRFDGSLEHGDVVAQL